MKCFACDRKIGYNALTAETRDAQVVFVGRECAKLIEAAGEAGYQPPKGGPRLYSIHLKVDLSVAPDFTKANGEQTHDKENK